MNLFDNIYLDGNNALHLRGFEGMATLLVIVAVWLFFVTQFIRSRNWQIRLIGWVLLVGPIYSQLMGVH